MDLEAELRRLAEALQRANAAGAENAAELAALRTAFDHLLPLLIGKGVLNDGNLKHLDKAAAYARRSDKPRVRLRVLDDKHAIPDAGIDCPSLFDLCQARCCTLGVELTVADLDDGIKWELERPYLLRHDADGYCAHIDRATLGCTTYPTRPGPCRSYDCREDRRVWLDFAARVPAPMPDGLLPPRRG